LSPTDAAKLNALSALVTAAGRTPAGADATAASLPVLPLLLEGVAGAWGLLLSQAGDRKAERAVAHAARMAAQAQV
jgi:hypothetical protein